jgi:carbonic anhydrase/acetyltransferase-like protein (isoleucine patch superfamily)
MAVYALGESHPKVPQSAWVAESASVVGRVELGEQTSVWFGAVIRGDQPEPIVIGHGSNIQDGAVLHSDPGKPLQIGAHVSVGHQAMLHGCTVGNGSLIGIGAIVLNNAVIGENCLVGAGALVTEGKVFEPGSLIMGCPARVVRALSPEEIERIHRNTAHYVARIDEYKSQLKNLP